MTQPKELPVARLVRERKPRRKLVEAPALNIVDEHRAAEHRTERLKQAARDEAIELGPQLVGALEGLAGEIRDQRHVTERMIGALERLELTCRGLTDELAALRSMRPKNGHATDLHEDLLDNEGTPQ